MRANLLILIGHAAVYHPPDRRSARGSAVIPSLPEVDPHASNRTCKETSDRDAYPRRPNPAPRLRTLRPARQSIRLGARRLAPSRRGNSRRGASGRRELSVGAVRATVLILGRRQCCITLQFAREFGVARRFLTLPGGP